MRMTVQEVIDELEKIEDKSLIVGSYDDHIDPMTRVWVETKEGGRWDEPTHETTVIVV